jgi:hypothetical protein
MEIKDLTTKEEAIDFLDNNSLSLTYHCYDDCKNRHCLYLEINGITFASGVDIARFVGRVDGLLKGGIIYPSKETARVALGYKKVKQWWSKHTYSEPFTRRLVFYDDNDTWHAEIFELPGTGEVIVF